MARAPRPALIAALALSSGACTPPQYHFQLEDLSVGNPAPPAKILVGEHVVVRAENGGGPDGWRLWARIDVFPVGAVLAGAWVKIATDRNHCEGPATIYRDQERYVVGWWAGLDTRDCSAQPTDPGPTSTITWLGPVCIRDSCETFRLDDADWPVRQKR